MSAGLVKAAATSMLESARGGDLHEGLAMVCPPEEAYARLQKLQAFVQRVLVEGRDYGKIKGVAREVLFKPGAEKLAEIYGLAHRYVIEHAVRDWEKGFFYFEMRCQLEVIRTGAFAGEAIGSCNTRESRYANRWVTENNIPEGLERTTLKWKELPSKYRSDEVYRVYLIENDDPFTLVNTIQKLACKRALVAAVISVTRSSDIFTQDVEDLPPEAFGQRDPMPANVPLPAASGPTVPRSHGPTVPRDHGSLAPENASPAVLTLPVPDLATMTEREQFAVRIYEAQFQDLTTQAQFTTVRVAAAAAGGGNKASRAYQMWFRAMVLYVQAKLGTGPGPVRSTPSTSSNTATSPKAAAS
jgi:hypothetical protein